MRPFRDDDWCDVHAYASDPVVTQFLNFGPLSEDQSQALVRNLAASAQSPQASYSFAITTLADGALIGGCSLYRAGAPDGRAELLYLLNRQYWGCGYMPEAIRGLLNFGFLELDLHRIFGHCDPENTASARVMEKAGMAREGLLRQERWVKNQWSDVIVYAALAGDWNAAAL
ncbi:MAG: GCN5-related N-acetyltransferase [Capsulimonas sp.]|nr:GCN5-related N-acetyltransferase [Capsulimonas sp.]